MNLLDQGRPDSDYDAAAEAALAEQQAMLVGTPNPFDKDDDEPVAATPANRSTGPNLIAPSPKDPDLSQEETNRAVVEILTTFRGHLAVDDAERTMVLEFGPLSELVSKLTSFADDLVDPEVADVLKTEVRRAAHETVVRTPVLTNAKNSQEWLEARASMLELMKSLVDSRTTTLINDLVKHDARGVHEFGKQMYGQIDAEERRVAQMLKTMTPPTLGESIFNSLKNAITSASSNELVGDARRHRNKQLTGALEELTDHAGKLKEKAGDAEWERAEGAMARKAVEHLTGRIKDLTVGVEDQIDGPALRKNLDTVHDMLDEAAKNSTDPDHKQAMESMVERMRALVQALAEALGRMFGKTAETPKPT